MHSHFSNAHATIQGLAGPKRETKKNQIPCSEILTVW
jgi:hypothetical protein